MNTELMRRAGVALGAGLLLASTGCGGAAVPHGAQAEATAAMRSAREVGAEGQPQASYYLELAEEQMASAEALIDEGQMQRAERLLRQAEADAELAIALTRVAAVSQDASETRDRIRDMRERHL